MTGTGAAARTLPSFVADRAFILERMRRSRAALKIILKTKDDPLFLDDWIAHHAALVGHENLIVLDNGSTDPGVLAAYAALAERVLIFRFDGYYNDVHFPARFADFYAALRASCTSFLFIDTDEFLTCYDAGRMRTDRAALAPIYAGIQGDFIPTTRLEGVELCRDRFVCGTDQAVLRQDLKWGKPIMRAASEGWPELINHNVHLRGVLEPHAQSGYFVLHRAFLSLDRRIRANVDKLIARGFMQAHESLDAALSRDASDEVAMVQIYLDEIRRMRTLQAAAPAADTAPLAPGTLRIAADGTVEFASPVEADVFRDYLATFPAAVREVIQADAAPAVSLP